MLCLPPLEIPLLHLIDAAQFDEVALSLHDFATDRAWWALPKATVQRHLRLLRKLDWAFFTVCSSAENELYDFKSFATIKNSIQ